MCVGSELHRIKFYKMSGIYFANEFARKLFIAGKEDLYVIQYERYINFPKVSELQKKL